MTWDLLSAQLRCLDDSTALFERLLKLFIFQSTDVFSALEVSATQWESYKSTVYITLHTLHISDYLELPQFSVPQDPAESQACLSLAAESIRLAHTHTTAMLH